MYFAVLEEIYNNVVPHWSAILISCNHSITKTASNQRSILSVYDPRDDHFFNIHLILCNSYQRYNVVRHSFTFLLDRPV